MADFNNKLPPYTDEPPQYMNPYHVGYDQPPSQKFVPRSQGFVAAPQGAMVKQQTTPGPRMSSNTVVVANQPQPTILINRSRGSDLTVPALLVCFFCCWCTGIPAIIYASKAQNEYGGGNWDKAESNQRTARGWIIGSVVSNVCIWILFVILYFAMLSAVASQFNDYNLAFQTSTPRY